MNDQWIKNIVKQKSHLPRLNITIFEDQRLYGMMAGFPPWPKMILSEGLYTSFNQDELEWVVLHEAGHCVLWHNFQALIFQILILTLGFFLINYFYLTSLSALGLAIIFGLGCIQIFRWTIEYAADKYAIARVANPQGVITAQAKFRQAKVKNPFGSEDSVMRFILHWNIHPSIRIKMAGQRMTNNG